MRFIPPHSLKAEFAEIRRLRKKTGVSGALRELGLAFHGTPHRGIDDARNVARIYAALHRG